MSKILLLESIHPIAVEILKSEGYEVRLESKALSENELISTLPFFDIVGIRSKTQLTKSVLEKNKHLIGIGAFCIGTDQVNSSSASLLGIPVFNAPHSNTRSVAELIIGEVIALSRQLGDKNLKAHNGVWDKSAVGSREIRNKTLGIIGYGNIGSQVSVLAESLGMNVIFYDVIKKLPLGNATSCSRLSELLAKSDFVTLHVPDTADTRNMISARELSLMKRGSYLLNASRGKVVDISDLVSVLNNKHLGGAAVDVFPNEPASNKDPFISELQGLDNVILTPHIGGSTEESQEAIGKEVAHSFLQLIKDGSTAGAVNFPNLTPNPMNPETSRIINVHKNEPGVLGNINSIVAEFSGNITSQYLSTNSDIGYLVMDIQCVQSDEILNKISNLGSSIKTRVIK